MWARGEQGERLVGAELDTLPLHSWWVFHAVPRGSTGTDIDHLVIGVGGVYTVNTKNVTGSVWVAERALLVDGQRTSYLPAAAHEARDTARRISKRIGTVIDIRPILAFTRPITIKAMPSDVVVLQAGAVRAWIEKQPHVLTPEQAYEIVVIADKPTTWA